MSIKGQDVSVQTLLHMDARVSESGAEKPNNWKSGWQVLTPKECGMQQNSEY